jgi:putative tricarboxylic transport membrane protein
VKISDTVVGAGFATAGALVIAGTLGYPSLDAGHPGPSLFPRLLGGLMVLFGGAVGWLGLRAGDTSERVEWRELPRNAAFVNALVVLASVVLYVLLVDRLGFLIVGALVLAVVMWRLEVPFVRALVIAVALTLAVHAMFAKVLRVPLPLGLLWW